jgi:hypothetical protein
MATKTLDDRRQALEEAFFKKENVKLLENLRAHRERVRQREALSAVMKLQDEAVLDQLIDAGIRAETWLAISLVPLIEVAWADRKMDDKEQRAILKAAAENGIEEGSDARKLLDKWLTRRPLPKLREAWAAYVGSVIEVLGDAARDALREEVLEGSRAVAEAAGGFLGFGPRVSEAEEAVLDELRRTF